MEYNIDFAERLIDAADSFFEKADVGNEAARAVLYLSLLSCEISLKAVLESAGYTTKQLTARSHNINGLITEICRCEIPGSQLGGFVSAAKLLSISPIHAVPGATVGKILDAESEGASKYPNEIRYGDLITHYDAAHVLKCAKSVAEWSKANMGSIRRRQ